jgi:hypothetical protein
MAEAFAGLSMKEVQEKSLQFLVQIYEASNGVAGRLVDVAPIMAALDLTQHEYICLQRSASQHDRVMWGSNKPGTETTGLTTAGVRFAEEIIAKDTAYKSDPAWQNIERKAMQSIKSYRGLTLIHQGLINNIVNGTRKCDSMGCKMLWMINDEKIGFINIVDFFPAKTADIEFLEQRGWVEIERESATAARVRASNKSHLANLRQFGRSKPRHQLSTDEHVIICAAYAEAGGNINQQFLADSVAKTLGRWTVDAVSQALTYISNKGYAKSLGTHGNFGGLFLLTPEGAALAAEHEQIDEFEGEDNQMKASIHMGDNIYVKDSNGVAIQNRGTNNAQTVTQTRSDTVTTINTLLSYARGQLADVPAEAKQHAEEALDNLAEEAKASEPKPSKIRAYASMALSHVPGVAAFTKTVLEIAKLCNVDPATILHHSGH